MNHRPEWIKTTAPRGTSAEEGVKEILSSQNLNTVCREADCPNQGECWGEGTATFMLLGKLCTRNCRFCDVAAGNPNGEVNEDEPKRIKKAVRDLELDYVVLTSVDRDDLPDGGAGHFRDTVNLIRKIPDPPLVEVLIPDFSGETSSLKMIKESGVEVVGHNIETVERLTSRVRDPRAGYQLSLSVLEKVKELDSGLVTKSSIMVGLGENKREVVKTMEDLKRAGVDIVTIGQYLRPTEAQLPVEKFWKRSEFENLKVIGNKLGFSGVVSGPFVRSSYKAKETYLKAR
ncbi:MAG: lipoyl synthase [Candidatus Bipolaricaulota bacterium]